MSLWTSLKPSTCSVDHKSMNPSLFLHYTVDHKSMNSLHPSTCSADHASVNLSPYHWILPNCIAVGEHHVCSSSSSHVSSSAAHPASKASFTRLLWIENFPMFSGRHWYHLPIPPSALPPPNSSLQSICHVTLALLTSNLFFLWRKVFAELPLIISGFVSDLSLMSLSLRENDGFLFPQIEITFLRFLLGSSSLFVFPTVGDFWLILKIHSPPLGSQ